MIGIPRDLVKTPSGKGKTTCSSALVGLSVVVAVDEAKETDETELGIRLVEFLIVDDEDEEVNIVDDSVGSI